MTTFRDGATVLSGELWPENQRGYTIDVSYRQETNGYTVEVRRYSKPYFAEERATEDSGITDTTTYQTAFDAYASGVRQILAIAPPHPYVPEPRPPRKHIWDATDPSKDVMCMRCGTVYAPEIQDVECR